MIRVSTEGLVAPGQIGWVFFFEGRVEIAAKVIRHGARPYISLPTVRKNGTTLQIVRYPNREDWIDKAKELVQYFRDMVGDEYFFSTVTSPSSLESD